MAKERGNEITGDSRLSMLTSDERVPEKVKSFNNPLKEPEMEKCMLKVCQVKENGVRISEIILRLMAWDDEFGHFTLFLEIIGIWMF